MLRLLERGLLLLGTLTVGLFVVSYATTRAQATQAVDAFASQLPAANATKQHFQTLAPDTSLWSPERIEAFQHTADSAGNAIGVLKIRSADIEAPIYAGASDSNLDRGIGWIEGTARLGQAGNVGLAAHRDGFFRALQDIELGDKIHTQTLSGERAYQVTATDVVSPDDVYVLDQTNSPTLTLVTCHPFYFVGSAPNRFVVYAVAVDHLERVD